MAVPKLDLFMKPCLLYFSEHTECSMEELWKYCADALQLTDADRTYSRNSGKSRTYWAVKYMRIAGLMDAPRRGIYTITTEGRKVLAESCTIDRQFLRRYPTFQAYCNNSSNFHMDAITNITSPEQTDLQTPQEMIEDAVQQLHASLSDDLLREISKISPYDFEHLVVRLLIKMGYGDLSKNQDAVTRKSGDEGIDGVVTSDEFGFDSVYIQAKKWKTDSVVGRPEIMKFMGALAGQGATKGLFITTTKFSADAIEYAGKQLQHKIVLVDGKRLTDLMIKFNLGVSVEDVIEIKKIDTDFFEGEF